MEEVFLAYQAGQSCEANSGATFSVPAGFDDGLISGHHSSPHYLSAVSGTNFQKACLSKIGEAWVWVVIFLWSGILYGCLVSVGLLLICLVLSH